MQSLSIIIHSSAVTAAVVHAILARQFQKEGGPDYYYFLKFLSSPGFVVNDARTLILNSMTFCGSLCRDGRRISSSWPTADQG